MIGLLFRNSLIAHFVIYRKFLAVILLGIGTITACTTAPTAIPTEVIEIEPLTATVDAAETPITSLIKETNTPLPATPTPTVGPTATPYVLEIGIAPHQHSKFAFTVPAVADWEFLDRPFGMQMTAPDGDAAITVYYQNTSTPLIGRDFSRFAKTMAANRFGGLGDYSLRQTTGSSTTNVVLEQIVSVGATEFEIISTFTKNEALVYEVDLWRAKDSQITREMLTEIAADIEFEDAVLAATFPYAELRQAELLAQQSVIDVPLAWEQIGADDDKLIQFRSPDSAAVVFALRRELQTEGVTRESTVDNVLKILRELVGPDIVLVSNRVQPDNSLRVDFAADGYDLEGSVYVKGVGSEANLLGYVLEAEQADYYWDVIDTVITSYQ